MFYAICINLKQFLFLIMVDKIIMSELKCLVDILFTKKAISITSADVTEKRYLSCDEFIKIVQIDATSIVIITT